MSPVHVIVGDDQRAEAMWAGSFQGAVDIYRFDRNVDAFERLTAAQAPIDLVVLTPAQRGPFNLTPDQFVARVLEGPLGSSSTLANLHVIVVGGELTRQHPRAMAVSTLDAAIRLVKFGEVERAPKPRPVVPAAPVAPVRRESVAAIDDLAFSGSIISRIWNAGDESAARGEEPAAPAAPAAPATPAAPVAPMAEPVHADVTGGGGAAQQLPAGPAQLFSRAAPAGFVAAGGPATATAPAPAAAPAQPQVAPLADPIPVGVPGESVVVGTGAQLQPSRPYQLPNGAGYRGPAVRGGVVHAAGHDAGGQPVPPALAAQVQTMVYGGMQVGNPHDPVMVWSSAARGETSPVPGGPVAGAQPAAPVAVPMTGTVTGGGAHAPAIRTLPLEPPAGAYHGVAQAAAPAPAPTRSSDPFLQRAEARGGDVSFG